MVRDGGLPLSIDKDGAKGALTSVPVVSRTLVQRAYSERCVLAGGIPGR